MKSTIPHMYAQTQEFLRKKGGASFGTARRGSPHREDSHFTPAPGAYETVYHNSVVNNYSELTRPKLVSPKNETRHASVDRSLHSQKLKNVLESKLNSNSASMLSIDSKETGYLSSSLKGPTFGLNHNKKVFAREFGSDFLTRQSPGPLAYDVLSTKSRFTKGVGSDASKFSFGKCNRGLKFEKNNQAPSPISYKAEIDRVKKGSPRAIISQAQRTIDVRKYASLNSYIWSKGMAV